MPGLGRHQRRRGGAHPGGDVITPPTNTGAASDPTITGTLQLGNTLTATFADDDPEGAATSIAYSWFGDGVLISGANGPTLDLAAGQVGKAITVTIAYTDGAGFHESVTSEPTDAIADADAVDTGTASDPTITGTEKQGEILTAHFADDDPDGSGSAPAYAWLRDDVAIDGATASTYELTADDVGAAITVAVTYTDAKAFEATVTSAATGTIAEPDPVDLGDASSPTITGTAQSGETLTSSFADDDPNGAASGITYQWLADGVAITGETADTLDLTDAEIGAAISVAVSYTDADGFGATVTSAETDAVIAADSGDAGTVWSDADWIDDGGGVITDNGKTLTNATGETDAIATVGYSAGFRAFEIDFDIRDGGVIGLSPSPPAWGNGVITISGGNWKFFFDNAGSQTGPAGGAPAVPAAGVHTYRVECNFDTGEYGYFCDDVLIRDGLANNATKPLFPFTAAVGAAGSVLRTSGLTGTLTAGCKEWDAP